MHSSKILLVMFYLFLYVCICMYIIKCNEMPYPLYQLEYVGFRYVLLLLLHNITINKELGFDFMKKNYCLF